MSLSLPRDTEKCPLHWAGPHQSAAPFIYFYFYLFVFAARAFVLQGTVKLYLVVPAPATTGIINHSSFKKLALKFRTVGSWCCFFVLSITFFSSECMYQFMLEKVWIITQKHNLTKWNSLCSLQRGRAALYLTLCVWLPLMRRFLKAKHSVIDFYWCSSSAGDGNRWYLEKLKDVFWVYEFRKWQFRA